MTARLSESVGVCMLINRFVPIHVQGTIETILPHFETNREDAEKIAQIFAHNRKIPYESNLHQKKLPLMTVVCQDNQWYPAKLESRGLMCVKKIKELNLGSPLARAVKYSQSIAAKGEISCDPGIGIAWNAYQLQKKQKLLSFCEAPPLTYAGYILLERAGTLASQSHKMYALHLRGDKISDSVLQEIFTRLPHLRTVTLDNCSISCKGLESLGSLKSLESLILRNFPRMTESDFLHLPLDKLQYLEARGLPLIAEFFLDQCMINHEQLQQLVSDADSRG